MFAAPMHGMEGSLMTTFQERERAFEAKFAHDEEFRFRVTARRDKLMAIWASKRLQLPDQESADLVASVLAVHDGTGHDERLLAYLENIFRDHNNRADAGELGSVMNRPVVKIA